MKNASAWLLYVSLKLYWITLNTFRNQKGLSAIHEYEWLLKEVQIG